MKKTAITGNLRLYLSSSGRRGSRLKAKVAIRFFSNKQRMFTYIESDMMLFLCSF